MNHKSYEGSHALLAGIEIIAWLAASGGAVMAALAIGDPGAVVPLSFWIGASLASIGLAALCRVGRAILDVAENSGRTAAALERAGGRPAGPATIHPDAPAVEPKSKRGWPIGQIEIYRGHVITGLQDRVFSDNRYFDSVEEAKQHLNSVPYKSV